MYHTNVSHLQYTNIAYIYIYIYIYIYTHIPYTHILHVHISNEMLAKDKKCSIP